MFSKDGRTYSDPEKIVFDPKPENTSNWLWRVTWNGDTGYGVSYGFGDAGRTLILYETKDGINYKQVKSFDVEGFPNEERFPWAAPVALEVGEYDNRGEWGVADAPYTDWDLKRM